MMIPGLKEIAMTTSKTKTTVTNVAWSQLTAFLDKEIGIAPQACAGAAIRSEWRKSLVSILGAATLCADAEKELDVLQRHKHSDRKLPFDAMTSPFKNPSNHRFLATAWALIALYGEHGHGQRGVTEEMRLEAVNKYLVSRGKAPVSRDTIRRALRFLGECDAAERCSLAVYGLPVDQAAVDE